MGRLQLIVMVDNDTVVPAIKSDNAGGGFARVGRI